MCTPLDSDVPEHLLSGTLVSLRVALMRDQYIVYLIQHNMLVSRNWSVGGEYILKNFIWHRFVLYRQISASWSKCGGCNHWGIWNSLFVHTVNILKKNVGPLSTSYQTSLNNIEHSLISSKFSALFCSIQQMLTVLYI